MQKAEVAFEITDAPSDDAAIKSVMVTVAEVRVDGKKVEGVGRQTIDLKAYREGNTMLLGSSTIDAKSYGSLELVLDTKSDAQQSGKPGCYVITTDNQVQNLVSGGVDQLKIVSNSNWKTSAGGSNRMVIDFDLRKSIRHSSDGSSNYSFVSTQNLNSAVRVVSKDNSGFIKGTYSNETGVEADKIVVYAYRKGSFKSDLETKGQTADAITFRNAVASAEVTQGIAGNAYTIAYLPEGDYELHFVAYNKNTATGRMQLTAMLKSDTYVSGQVQDFIQVKGGATVNVNVSVSGIIE